MKGRYTGREGRVKIGRKEERRKQIKGDLREEGKKETGIGGGLLLREREQRKAREILVLGEKVQLGMMTKAPYC